MSTAPVNKQDIAAVHAPPDPEFEQLYEEYSRLVYRAAFHITANPQDAEDVLQSVFLNLLKAGNHRDFRRNPKAYLYRASVNLSLSVLRSRKRRKLREETHSLSDSPHPDEADLAEERDEKLLNALARLKPKAAEILLLHYKDNLSDMEIASMLGKSRGTVAVTLYRIRRRLKRLLTEAPSAD